MNGRQTTAERLLYLFVCACLMVSGLYLYSAGKEITTLRQDTKDLRSRIHAMRADLANCKLKKGCRYEMGRPVCDR